MKKEVKEFCNIFNLTENQFFGIDKISCDLYLDNNKLTSLPDGFNPTVGGDLYLYNNKLTSLPDGFNPTVGGNLYLDNNNLTRLPKFTNTNYKGLLSWQNGKYIKIDGIFCEVISKRMLFWKVKKYASNKEFYVVTDGNENYSHGDTIKEAKEDLIYKISNRSKDDYKELTYESILKFDEAVKCYRVITGACQFGVKEFLQRKAINKKKFSIQEIIKLTNGEYGNTDFKQFFN
jgi:Leucine-rich repeat (LRR) protein